MPAPSGVPAPDPRDRLRMAEDDYTFAPPPMSAYSIAVLSNNSKAKPAGGAATPGSATSSARYSVKFKNNGALQESLKRKLSSHFHGPPSSSPSSPSSPRSMKSESNASRIPAGVFPNSPGTSPIDTAHSAVATANSVPTSILSSSSRDHIPVSSRGGTTAGAATLVTDAGPGNANSISASSSVAHDDTPSHPINTTSSSSSNTTHNTSNNESHSNHGFSTEGQDISSKSLFEANSRSSQQTAWLSNAVDQQPRLQAPIPDNSPKSGLASSRSHDYLSLKDSISESSKTDSNKVDANFMAMPSTSAERAFFSTIPPRPVSNGSLNKRSRISRRFHTLGPPKRASEMGPPPSLGGLPESVVDTRTSIPEPQQSLAEKQSSISQNSRDNQNRSPGSSMKEESSFSKRGVSTDSDFFKSLKRLKEASPNNLSFGTNLARRSQSPSYSIPPRTAKTEQNHAPLNSDMYHHAQAPIISRHFQSRQPLKDVSPDVFNISHGSDGFKKPRMPNSHPQEKHSVPKDPTPQIEAKPSSVRSADVPSQNRNSESGDDSRKKIIYVNSRQYEKLEILGRGGSSKVYKVRSLSDKRPYALKKVSFDQFDESCVRGFKGEIDLLKRLRNELRVVSLIDHASGPGSLYLLMECGDIDLAHVLQNKLTSDSKLDPNFVRFHASEVFHCIQAVHNAGIVHSDLKPANFLFVGGTLKIIDFGIANAVPDHTVNIYRHSQIGTPNYMAPEALVEVDNTLSLASKGHSTTWKVGRPSDIWSCGCIIYQMIYGRPPYAGYSGQQRILAIMNAQVKVQYPATGLGEIPVPGSAIELMKKCLERNPNHRWTVEECLDCDFLKPKAVNEVFVRDFLRSAVNLGYQGQNPESIDERSYNELVSNILGQIKDLNFA